MKRSLTVSSLLSSAPPLALVTCFAPWIRAPLLQSAAAKSPPCVRHSSSSESDSHDRNNQHGKNTGIPRAVDAEEPNEMRRLRRFFEKERANLPGRARRSSCNTEPHAGGAKMTVAVGSRFLVAKRGVCSGLAHTCTSMSNAHTLERESENKSGVDYCTTILRTSLGVMQTLRNAEDDARTAS